MKKALERWWIVWFLCLAIILVSRSSKRSAPPAPEVKQVIMAPMGPVFSDDRDKRLEAALEQLKADNPDKDVIHMRTERGLRTDYVVKEHMITVTAE